MKRRKQAKTITKEEFLSKRNDIFNCDLEDILCAEYVYILDAMDMEDFEYDDTSLDIFREIVHEGKVVGYASYMKEDYGLLLMEFYVMPEYRGNGLLCREISSMDNLSICLPKISMVKALINCDMARELSDGIVVSEIPFNVSSFDLERDADKSEYFSHVYDLKSGCVLLVENPESFNYSSPARTDKLRRKLENVTGDALCKAYKTVSDYDEKYLEVKAAENHPTIVFLV